MTDTEKAALERRIDELCAELSTTQLNCDLWHDRAEDMRNRLSASQAEKAALCTRIDELCQENERLRALADGAANETDRLTHDAAALQIENAKLRELCASLFRLANNECLSNTRRCGDCPMNRDEPPCNLSLDFIAMRKLGIDVTPWEVERIEVSS